MSKGCALRTQPTISLDNVGEQNVIQLTNWRRQEDQLVRREGWSKFAPTVGVAAATQYEYDTAEDVQRLGELTRPNGERVFLGASQTKIKRFNATLGVWETIGTGFSSDGLRWQMVVINGYAIFNNAVDLPVVYRVEWRTTLPIYELREVGVASVGRIADYNGFLFVLDITRVRSDQLNNWMSTASAPYGIVTADLTQRYPLDVAWSEYAEPRKWAPLFNITQASASTTVTLPFPSAVLGTVVTQYTVASTSGAAGATFDGSYVWFLDFFGGNTRLVKVDPAAGTITTVAVTGSTGSTDFAGLNFDGTNLWLVPYDFGSVVKYNLSTGTFTSYAHAEGASAFYGSTFDGTYLWLTPYGAANIVRVTVADGTLATYAHGQGTPAFRGDGAYDGTSVWMPPWDSTKFLKINASTGAITLKNNTHGTAAFSGCCFDGKSVWFAPYDSAVVSIILVSTNVESTFTHGLGGGAFSGTLFDGSSVWIMPLAGGAFLRGSPATGSVTTYVDASASFAWSAFDGQSFWATKALKLWRTVPPIEAGVTGQSNVGIVNAGADGGILGGQTNYENGIRVTDVSGAALTLELTTDTVLSYPRNISVTRWTDINSIVGYQTLEGQEIITAMKLGLYFVVYLQTGIYVGRYTGIASEPFQFRPRYEGNAVPMFADCVANVEGRYHLYPGLNGRFMAYDAQSDPQEQLDCTHARDLFFSGLTITDSCWASDLPFFEEALFLRPDTTMAFCYERDNQGVSEIDAQIDAACYCQKPGGTPYWFVIGIGRYVYQYGYENNAGTTWLRDGAAAVPAMKSGLVALGDPHNEKTLLSYTPLLSSPSPDMEMTVNLYGTYNPSAAVTTLLSGEVLPSPQGENYIPCLYQQIYLQDEIQVTDTRDMDCRLSGRLFTVDRVHAGGVTRLNS